MPIGSAEIPALEKIPTAADITEAFQARTKIAPAPKINEKISVKIKT